MKFKYLNIILICTFIMSGCSTKEAYSEYRHYKKDELKGKEVVLNHHLIKDDKYIHEYSIIDMTEPNADLKEYGLLYHQAENDYVLTTNLILANGQKSAKFSKDKLYTIEIGAEGGNYMYTLNGAEIKRNRLDFTEIGYINSIEEISENYISFLASDPGTSSFNDYHKYKCLLTDYTCTLEENE